MNGIYCYKDTFKNDEIVYVGRDSHIDKNTRHRVHLSPSRYDKQPFNRILQNNPDRYSYHILKKGNFDDNLLNALEILYIRRYAPKFNFTVGGDGISGYKHSSESKRKMSESHKGVKNNFYGKHHTIESRKKISEARKGTSLSEECKRKISKANNTTGYRYVHKVMNPKFNQGFIWKYAHRVDGKLKTISRVDINELEKEVKSRGLPWEKF